MPESPFQTPFLLSPGHSSLVLTSVKLLKSASTKISLVTYQQLTHGLFNRLDAVIAYPEEITNPGRSFARKRAVSQLPRAGYA